MKIGFLQNRINNNVSYKNLTPPSRLSDTSFKGATKVVEKMPLNNPRSLEIALGVNNTNGIVGEPPKDVARIISSNSQTKFERDSKIKAFMGSISEASKILRETEDLGLKNLENFDFSKYVNSMFETMRNGEMVQEVAFYRDLYGFNSIKKEDLDRILKDSALCIEQTAQEIGLIPEDGRVEMKFLGRGLYGYGLSVSFLDGEDKKVIHDKVIKLYTSDSAREFVNKTYLDSFREYHSTKDFDEYWDEFLSANITSIEKTYRKCYADFDVDEETIDEVIDYAMDCFETLKEEVRETYEHPYQADDSEILKNIGESKTAKFAHGLYPETNRALFIKNSIGDMRKTNYIEEHFADLKNGYAFMEMADDELGEVKKEINIEKQFSLFHGDLNMNNTVCNRVVDYGGIQTWQAVKNKMQQA